MRKNFKGWVTVETVKDRIKKLCEEQGIKSLRKLEELSGVPYNVITKWDRFRPSAQNLALVADYLHVSTDYLLTGDDKEADKNDTPTAVLVAVGDNETVLLESFRELSNKGKYKILMLISEELEREKGRSSVSVS